MEFFCGQCGQRGSVSPSAAGKRVKCPGCGTGIVLPSPALDPPRIARPTGTLRAPAKVARPLWWQCAKCDALLQTDALGGQSDRCPHCGAGFVVPMTPDEKTFREAQDAWAHREAALRSKILDLQAAAEQARRDDARRTEEAEARRVADEQRAATRQRAVQAAKKRIGREVARDCGSLAVSEGIAFDDADLAELCAVGRELLAALRSDEAELPALEAEILTIDADLERGRLIRTRQRLAQLQAGIEPKREALKDAQVELGLRIADRRVMPETFGLFFKRLDAEIHVDDDGHIIAPPAPL